MFEIGPSLREARERRGLGYTQVELDTAIRSRYVRALEEEDFGILPGPTYTKGFLRAYADYLGLDGELFVDEFNSRHHDPRREFDQPIASRPRSRPQQHRRRRESHLALIVLAAIVAVTSIDLPGGAEAAVRHRSAADDAALHEHHEDDRGHRFDDRQQSTGTETSTGTTKKAPVAHKEFTVLLTASASCWVTLHTGAPERAERDLDSTAPTWATTRSTRRSTRPSSSSPRSRVHDRRRAGSLTISIDGKDTPLPDGVGAGTVVRIDQQGPRSSLSEAPTRPTAAVLLTGNELLRGVISDLNASHLARDLELRGFTVERSLTVGTASRRSSMASASWSPPTTWSSPPAGSGRPTTTARSRPSPGWRGRAGRRRGRARPGRTRGRPRSPSATASIPTGSPPAT